MSSPDGQLQKHNLKNHIQSEVLIQNDRLLSLTICQLIILIQKLSDQFQILQSLIISPLNVLCLTLRVPLVQLITISNENCERTKFR